MATPPNPAPTAKLCARCRKPIDTRAQDAFHAMYCGECSAALKAAVQRLRRPEAAAPNPTPVHATPRVEPAIKPEPPPIPLAEHILLTPEDHGPALVRSVPPPPPEKDDLSVSPPDPTLNYETRICLNCSQRVDAHNPICAFCQFDARKGLPKKLAEAAAAPPTCRKCGYELTGLMQPVCPECGAKISLGRRANAYEADAREATRWAYLTPLIKLGVGILGLIIIDAIRHPGEWIYPVFTFIKFAVWVPAVWLTYICCCVAWIGFDMKLHLVALRIAGAFAVAMLIYGVLSFLPIPIIPMGFATLAYVWMLHQDLDLELQDAIIVSILSYGVAAVLAMTAVYKIAIMLGL